MVTRTQIKKQIQAEYKKKNPNQSKIAKLAYKAGQLQAKAKRK